MSYELQKAENRLDNIRKVKPILAALRTISLGSWQMARNRRAGLTAYTDRLLALLPVVVPHVVGRRRRTSGRPAASDRTAPTGRAVALVVGSERGLCGRYNKTVIAAVTDYLAQEATDADIEIGVLGSRMMRELRSAEIQPAWEKALSITSLPRYDYAYDLAAGWLRRFEAYELDRVDLIYNADRGAGSYAAVTVRLIPPELPDSPVKAARDDHDGAGPEPDPIIETDPTRLYARVVEQWTAIALYRMLLEAASTEHAARFQLMESATQNADDLVEDLMLTVNSARRQAITREMQELAISAGLLGA